MSSKQRADLTVSQPLLCPCTCGSSCPQGCGVPAEHLGTDVPKARGWKIPNKMQEVSKHDATIITGGYEGRRDQDNAIYGVQEREFSRGTDQAL